MDIVGRLKQFMDFTQLPSSQFADMAQIPRPTLSQIMNGRNKKISNELISKLHEAFPQLNVLWLMFGDGDMVFDENIEISEPLNEQNLFSQDTQMPSPQENTDINITEKTEPNFASSTQNPALSNDFPQKDETQASEAEPTILGNQLQLPIMADSSKKIASIMVFYSDNSFERFVPDKAN
jgi:transcriptional regulator with XRE-family HTH domain